MKVVAFVFTGYILSFVIDLLPSVRTRTRVPQGEKQLELADRSDAVLHGASLEEGLATDAAEPNLYRGQRI